ncbi:MAG: helix-turn-helix domain-containing protein [Methylocystis sp.]|uniref:helix-turn-helix domain-containing protein n=1 Tax=Methylocystis sp. TaxID=1911079 RepID=UPI003DA2EE62
MRPMATTIGSNIATVREALGYSQSSFARKINASQSAVSQIENGERNPSFDMLLRIKRALGVTWVGLLKGIE